MENRHHIIILLFTLFISANLHAQKSTLADADSLYQLARYEQAIPIYEKYIDQESTPISSKLNLAEAYRELSQYNKSAHIYDNLSSESDLPVEYYLERGENSMYLAEYNKAAQYFNQFKINGGKNENINTYIKSANWAPKHISEQKSFSTPIFEINGKYFGAAYWNGALIYTQPNQEKIKKRKSNLPYYHFTAKENGEDLSDDLSELNELANAKLYLGAPTFNKDHTEVYYTKNASNSINVRPAEYKKKNISSEGENTFNIYKATKVNGKWENQTLLQLNNREFSYMYPSLSRNHKRLYFASNMPGGHGGFDIWYVEDEGGEWGNPINAGEQINTPDQELYPYISQDSTLYFSSKGHIGFGGLDIYKSKLTASGWSEVKNLTHFNSSYNDFAINFKDKYSGIFASDRVDQPNTDAIYPFSLIKPIIGSVISEVTQAPLKNAKIEVLSNNKKIKTLFTNADGKWEFEPSDTQDSIELVVSAEGYKQSKVLIDSEVENESKGLNIELEKQLNSKTVLVLNNILFEYGNSKILSPAKKELDRLASLLKKTEAKISLNAYTDSRGSKSFNEKLSNRRAKACVDYLVQKGVAKNKIVSKGYGETKLLNKCKDGVECTEEEQAINRRLEIQVIELPDNYEIKVEKSETLYNL